MKNVQVTVDEETLDRVDRVAAPLGLNRPEVFRQALREWLPQHLGSLDATTMRAVGRTLILALALEDAL